MPLPSVFDEIDRLFDELIHQRWGPTGRALVPAHVHPVEDGWQIELPVEGLQASDLKIEVQGRRLTVSGRRHEEEHQRQGPRAWTRSQQHITMERTITLPVESRPEDVEAKIEGAMLIIRVRRRPR